MTNIVRRDPYAIDDLVEDLFKGYGMRPWRWAGEQPEMQMIKMDVKEDNGNYTVHAEMPGVKKEDIHITIDGNNVSVSAETRRESERKEGEKVLRSERYFGKVYRSFNLAQDVDEARAKARFENGVLELVLPKKTTAAARKLTVE